MLPGQAQRIRRLNAWKKNRKAGGRAKKAADRAKSVVDSPLCERRGCMYLPLAMIGRGEVYELAQYEHWIAHLRDSGGIPPIRLATDFSLLDGVHRCEAARDLGYSHVPCVFGWD